MKRLSSRTVVRSLTIAFFATATTPAFAVDPVCNQIRTAMHGLIMTPFHIYMTQTQSFADQTVAKAAGQIGMGGTDQSEEIWTGKTVYVMNKGKWIDMQISLAAMEQEKDSDPDIKQAIDNSKCKTLPDEAAYGQPASVYLMSTPELGIEKKIWVSKTTNLTLRTDMTNDQGGMKMFTVSRYEYSGVQAPAHAMTMKEMVESSGGR